MYQETKIQLVKPAERALRENVIVKNIASLVSTVGTKNLRNRGWTIDTGAWQVFDEPSDDMFTEYKIERNGYRYLYVATILIQYNGTDEPESGVRGGIIRSLATKCETPPFGRWTLARVGQESYELPAENDVTVDDPNAVVTYADCRIPADWDEHFSHLYGLEPHIRQVRRAIDLAIRTNFNTRTNVVLVGPPGCGKSDIADSVRRALGDEAVWRLDATATTAAGTIKEIADMELLPRIALFEEAEKASEKVTEPFLGILDQRGEVRKTTARGNVQRDARFLVISTVNDFSQFEKMNAGALESRHTVKVFFHRPSRDTLALILAREVDKTSGDTEWISPALDYCEEHGINDPRAVISLCLNGGDGWLDGSYVADLKATAQEERS